MFWSGPMLIPKGLAIYVSDELMPSFTDVPPKTVFTYPLLSILRTLPLESLKNTFPFASATNPTSIELHSV